MMQWPAEVSLVSQTFSSLLSVMLKDNSKAALFLLGLAEAVIFEWPLYVLAMNTNSNQSQKDVKFCAKDK